MQIQLLAGDHDWSAEGTHVLDDNGFAIILTEDKTIDVDDDTWLRITPIIEDCRVFRGLNPDGSVPVALDPEVTQEVIPDEPG